MTNKQYFIYGQKETDYLTAKDPALGKAIAEIGHINREIIPDLFMALVNSIIGQQISTKAQKTVWLRFIEKFSPVTAENIVPLPLETLQSCGISMGKALYIHQAAQSIVNGALNLEALENMDDAAVCKCLCQLKGVGVWTAEMLMIFSMSRPNILSWDDMAILRGLRMLHHHREITPALFGKYKKRYSPYGTVASLYLWKISHGACEGLVDLAPKNNQGKKTAPKSKNKG